MMTPNDGSNDGKSHPSLFPARNEIIDFCHELRQSRSIDDIKTLPVKSGASYRVDSHKGNLHINNRNRSEYFSGFNKLDNQIILLDPDNGFEPEKSFNEKHVRYKDITQILKQLPIKSVISVFQHHRRISFPNDFARIRERIESGYSTAIYWHSLMFVAVSKSDRVLNRVISANEKYAKTKPVEIIY